MSMPRIISLIDGKEYVIGRWFERHIKENGFNTIKDYYENFPELYNKIPNCSYCGKKVSVVKYTTEKYGKTCGDIKCSSIERSKTQRSKTKENKCMVNEKRRKTNLEKYGVEYVTQDEKIRQKTKETKNKITSCGLTIQELNTIAIQKSKEEKYGNRYYNNPKQITKTKSEHTAERKEEIINKRRKTNLEKYGVCNVLLLEGNERKVNKGNSSLKNYTLPSGKIIKIRGYEPKAIDKLLETYKEDDLIICDETNIVESKIPKFEYINEHKNKSLYYPDIYIPKENKIIEIKSRWWYDADSRKGYESRLKNNNHKKQSVIESGYNFDFWIYEKDGTLTII